jgi:hypothetical protein
MTVVSTCMTVAQVPICRYFGAVLIMPSYLLMLQVAIVMYEVLYICNDAAFRYEVILIALCTLAVSNLTEWIGTCRFCEPLHRYVEFIMCDYRECVRRD